MTPLQGVNSSLMPWSDLCPYYPPFVFQLNRVHASQGRFTKFSDLNGYHQRTDLSLASLNSFKAISLLSCLLYP